MGSSKIVQGATLEVYPGLPHGMCSTHKDQINTDLLAPPSTAPASSFEGGPTERAIGAGR